MGVTADWGEAGGGEAGERSRFGFDEFGFDDKIAPKIARNCFGFLGRVGEPRRIPFTLSFTLLSFTL